MFLTKECLLFYVDRIVDWICSYCMQDRISLTSKSLEDKLFNPFDPDNNLFSSKSIHSDPDIQYSRDVTYTKRNKIH